MVSNWHTLFLACFMRFHCSMCYLFQLPKNQDHIFLFYKNRANTFETKYPQEAKSSIVLITKALLCTPLEIIIMRHNDGISFTCELLALFILTTTCHNS